MISLSRSTPANLLETPIWQSIQYMDHEAMDILRNGGKEGTGKEFRKYLKRTGVSALFADLCNGRLTARMSEYNLRQEPDLGLACHHGSVEQDVENAGRDRLCAI
jgi:hypothetical protein